VNTDVGNVPGDVSAVWSFSQPYGPAALYGPPPYAYRKARTISAAVRLDRAGIAPYLPPGVEVDAEPVLGVIAASDYPESGFGPYRELSFFVRVTAFGGTFMYSPLMYADGEAAIAAGRELWGFAKKTAEMKLTDHGAEWSFSAERHAERVASLRFEPQERRTPDELALVDHPTLTLRLIPPLDGHGAPDVAQLISTVNVKTPRTQDGRLCRWTGAAEWVLSDTPLDPLRAFRPIEYLSAWMTEYDCNLPAGQLVHDYVTP
jgi:acetoacetate decarboxylase